MRKTVVIKLTVIVRDYTKAERDEEGLDKEDCEDAAASFDGQDLADTLAHYLTAETDEILAGSNSYVKIVAADGIAED